MAILAKVLNCNIPHSFLLFGARAIRTREHSASKRQGRMHSAQTKRKTLHHPRPKTLHSGQYPWEDSQPSNNIRITKEYFRCNGNSANPLKLGKEPLYDCGGKQKHSLPLQNNKEFIYPILIESSQLPPASDRGKSDHHLRLQMPHPQHLCR